MLRNSNVSSYVIIHAETKQGIMAITDCKM